MNKNELFKIVFDAPLGHRLVENGHGFDCEGCFFKLKNSKENDGWNCARNRHERENAGTEGRFHCGEQEVFKLKPDFEEIMETW